MTKPVTKRNKKEERKKLIVRIVCIVMVAALLLTSGLAMASWIFSDDDNYTILGYDEAGNTYALDESGNIVMLDEHGHVVDSMSMTSTEDTAEDGYDHSEDETVAE